MTIFNLGSINSDHLYQVAHLPEPGETLAADQYNVGLGGKGVNQSVAAVRAGSKVVHIGAIGSDGHWAKDQLTQYGVDTQFIKTVNLPTGHAIINLDRNGENAIITFSGANNLQDILQIENALKTANKDDILLLQNETTMQAEAAKIAMEVGMKVIYSAAPFSIDAVKKMLPICSILMMNKVESEQLCAGLETKIENIPVQDIIVTKGSNGVDWHSVNHENAEHIPSFIVDAKDTTAAGDTFAGYFAAGLDQGIGLKEAIRLGSAAAAIKVTRTGTAEVIPKRAEVDLFLERH